MLLLTLHGLGQNKLYFTSIDLLGSLEKGNSDNMVASENISNKNPDFYIEKKIEAVAQNDCCDRIDFHFDGVFLDTWAQGHGNDPWNLYYAVCQNKDFNLTADCHNPTGTGMTYVWYWGDGSPNSTGSSVYHAYTTPGVKVIKIIGTGNGCRRVTSYIRVTVGLEKCELCCPIDLSSVKNTQGLEDLNFYDEYPYPDDNTTKETIYTANVNCPRSLTFDLGDCENGSITWNWGDGSSDSYGTNATHSYLIPGTYTLLITLASNTGGPGVPACRGGSQKLVLTITKDNCPACCTKTKNFVTTSGYFTFTNSAASLELVADACKGSELGFSANCPYATTYLWDFGDGSQASGPNVVHTYAPTLIYGIYYIQVIIQGPSCNPVIETIKVNLDISHCPLCCETPFVMSTGIQNIAATGNPMTVAAEACPNTMMIFNANCPNVTNYTWNWGDGSPNSTGTPAAHAYSSAGSYAVTITPSAQGCLPFPQTISLNVSNTYCPPCCTDPFVTGNIQNLSLTNTPMVLTADACQYAPVTFTANCPGATGSGYVWNFGDGGTATGATVSHQYSGGGNFVVTVTSPNGSGCSGSIETINLTVSNTLCEPCCQLSAFIDSPDILNLIETAPGVYSAQICAGKAISLNALNCNSVASATYLWLFGDSGASAGINVSHTYATAGTYVLELFVSGAGCYQKQTINFTVVDCSCSGASIIGPTGGGCTDYPVSLSADGCLDPGAIYNWNFGDGTTATGFAVTHVYSGVGNYNLSLTIIHPPYAPITITSNMAITTCPLLNQCKDCIGAFSPEPGEYIISVWAKYDYYYPLSSSSAPGVKVSFVGNTASFGPFLPDASKSKVIDGWQRIEEKFTVPVGATSIKIELFNLASQRDCYFDDIRVYPVNASMKSYVYDPVTLRLAAELDENNFATYFEYDDEGKLIRVKKETERGVNTIKEARNSSKK